MAIREFVEDPGPYVTVETQDEYARARHEYPAHVRILLEPDFDRETRGDRHIRTATRAAYKLILFGPGLFLAGAVLPVAVLMILTTACPVLQEPLFGGLP